MWPLTGPYVEGVWSEILGPTATLLARRLGRCVEASATTRVSIDEVGRSLGISGSKVVKALRQLHPHHLVHFEPERRLIGVSGFAPSVRPDDRHRLSRAGQAEHARSFGEIGGAGGGLDRPPGCRAPGSSSGTFGRSL
jgi:hypothetical protein